MSEEMLDTPFNPLQRQYNDKVEFGPWGAYKSPNVMSDVKRENLAVRNNAIVFDMTPVNKYAIHGPDACRFLNYLTTRQMDIEPGRVTYTCWCNPNGKIIDDGTVFRVSENEYRLYPAANQTAYLQQVAGDFDVEVTDVTHDSAVLSVQGPKSFALLKEMGIEGLETLKPFRFADFTLGSEELRISRTGFSGDLGYELWMQKDQSETLWNALISVGVEPMGMEALLTMRLEAALILPDEGFELEGASYDGNSDSEMSRSPFEVDMAWLINWEKGDFIGRDALASEKTAGSKFRLIGLELEGTLASEFGATVLDMQGQSLGLVTSGCYSEALQRNIALASVTDNFGDVGQHCQVVIGETTVTATVVQRPFFNDPRRNAIPPQL
ncbi:aminomethyl transferase family protein [Pseudomaricurvus alkylphenolicus]|uniref:aminomethyltransferase family protein n=1 Tax=Pseudomaricurvus alkylphenolicus TaxID=1306991 RepID=UPI001420B35D|nr:aminomethyltransferase family protein [Pseudomaricurvus alkylphenolicus]NIB42192.1 aminomethyl transferase family protein [Pseudomaricurvus alkylphenolicus]